MKRLIFLIFFIFSNYIINAQECFTINKKLKLPQKITRKKSLCGLKTFFLPRSQGRNSARRLVGWRKYKYIPQRYCYEGPISPSGTYGNSSLTIEYTRSFKSERIAQYLFGSNCLHFSGSEVANRLDTDLLADYFGLPTTFEGTICFKPRIQNIILDLSHYLSLDPWCTGLYTQIYFPITITFWDLGVDCSELNNSDSIITEFDECYMGDTKTPSFSNIIQALTGKNIFGNMNSPFDFGKFPFSKRKKSGIADIDFILGWNFYQNPCYHAGIFLQTTIPGGNRPTGKIIFEPIVGNGKSWEFGLGFDGHISIIETENQIFQMSLLALFSYRFKSLQIRSFDFCKQGDLSRYLLLKEIDENNNYNGNLLNAIDLATKAVQAGDVAQLDASLKFSYNYCNLKFDLGYNIYVKANEKLKIVNNLFPSDLNNRNFAIKGTEGVCYKEFNPVTQQVVSVRPLNSSQSSATINRPGTIDNPQSIVTVPPIVPITWDSPETNDLTQLKIAQSSNPPKILTIDDLHLCSAAVPSQLTHKVFWHINYLFLCSTWEPQIGIGGEVEFDGNSKLLSSLNQWGIWFKFGVFF